VEMAAALGSESRTPAGSTPNYLVDEVIEADGCADGPGVRARRAPFQVAVGGLRTEQHEETAGAQETRSSSARWPRP